MRGERNSKTLYLYYLALGSTSFSNLLFRTLPVLNVQLKQKTIYFSFRKQSYLLFYFKVKLKEKRRILLLKIVRWHCYCNELVFFKCKLKHSRTNNTDQRLHFETQSSTRLNIRMEILTQLYPSKHRAKTVDE